jgi:predicted dienelactone hydrolase
MHADRRADIEAVIDDLLSSSEFRGVIDMQSIGAAGHSLGAYTVVGMVGGWSSWLDPPQGRISSLTNTSQFRARRIRIQTAGQ